MNKRIEINFIKDVLPDNRPITAFQIVEDLEKCPRNFIAISKSYDQDADVDLWKENVFFGKKTGRYLCLSKTEGLPDYVVETLKVIGDKERPPDGYSLLTRTADSEQKAWRKKQLVYKLVKASFATQAITDVILCSRTKKAPESFTLAGEINGILICFKSHNMTRSSNNLINASPNFTPHRAPPERPPRSNVLIGMMNSANISPNNADDSHDYERLRTSYNLTPVRAAPVPPPLAVRSTPQYSSATMGSYGFLDGVPFSLNTQLSPRMDISFPQFNSAIRATEYEYNFALERQLLNVAK